MNDPLNVEASEPIRGLRAMAVVRWVLLVLVAVLSAGTWWHFVFASEPVSDGRADRYYCPMHPDIRSADPGTCPICYMSLEPIPTAEPSETGEAEPDEDHEIALAPVMLTTERRQRAGIATVPARRTSIEAPMRWPASVELSEGARAEVRVRADAFVERVAIRGTRAVVRAGQPLAWVYSPEILRAQEELLVASRWQGPEAAQTVSAARQRLVLLGVSERDIDAIVESGQAKRTIPVRAPIGGQVTQFSAVVGTYATPSLVLYEITDFSKVRVVATPLEPDLGWLSGELAARFEPRSGEAVPLSFELLEPDVAGDTRASRVRFSASAALRPNDIGEVWVERPAREALVVPRDAVIDNGTRRYVFVEREGGLFEPRTVEIGELASEERIVTGGLEEGERVVARGAFVLDSESRLQAALAPAPSEDSVEDGHGHGHGHEEAP